MADYRDHTTLRLILGDQLDPGHSWFAAIRSDVVYAMMEVRQETDYVLHHAQKILAIFAAMRDFARGLAVAGHRVHYIAIDDPENTQSFPDNLHKLIRRYAAARLEYQAPDEWRLDRQLDRYARSLTIDARMVDSEHFYTERLEAAEYFGSRPRWKMEHFYRHMRRRLGVLLDDRGKPAGGRWNYDHENRKPWRGRPPEPSDTRPIHDHSQLWQTISQAGVASFGAPCAKRFRWPLNRGEALLQLDRFIQDALPRFGDFQDAMSEAAMRLFHSLLSFALNTKMLRPQEAVQRAEQAWRDGVAPLSCVEGFIRQILGWREYVRGVYWARMPVYEDSNTFDHARDLPEWFWTGKSHMNCMRHAITQSLQHAHAHHIQRLMIIGNFALLAGLDPAQVHRWYLGIYIDAFEWVELPNTLGMSQFADGGLLATKPYISSAAYIHRMSDYCAGCHYQRNLRTGPRACPYNALYWHFLSRHREKLAPNPRMAMPYRQLDRMSPDERRALEAQADALLGRLDEL